MPEIAAILPPVAPILAQLTRVGTPFLHIAPEIFAVSADVLEIVLHRVFVARLAVGGEVATVVAEVTAVAANLSGVLTDFPAIAPDFAVVAPQLTPILPDVLPILLRVVWPDVLSERRRRQKRRRHTGHRERDCEPHRFSPPLRDDCCALGRRLYVVAFTSRYISRNWLMLKAPTVDPRSLAARLQPLPPRR